MARFAKEADIAIVGGGFSGTMVAAVCVKHATLPLRIVIADEYGRFGQGAAYDTARPEHHLNVPAVKMGAFDDQPAHFFDWLVANGHAASGDEAAFMPRRLYGEYVATILRDARLTNHELTPLISSVIDVEKFDGGYALRLQSGSLIRATAVVLALGTPPPGRGALGAAPLDDPRVVNDPWEFLRSGASARSGRYLLAGSGLTALDVLATLDANDCARDIMVVSRRGMFPARHAITAAIANRFVDRTLPQTALEALRLVRREITRASECGADWRAVVDALRPVTQSIWMQWPLAEKRRFYRHLRPYWEAHRHRAAGNLIDMRNRLVAGGRLRIVRGGISSIDASGDTLRVTLIERPCETKRLLSVDTVVNCSGPAGDYRESMRLVRTLVDRGLIAAHETGVGLNAHPDGRLISAAGVTHDDLWTLGAPLRGVLYESSAVPELRRQAGMVAAQLVRRLETKGRLAV